MSRALRRRAERDLVDLRPNPGVGQGWRLSCGPWKRRVPVRENDHPLDLETLERESDQARATITTGVVER